MHSKLAGVTPRMSFKWLSCSGLLFPLPFPLLFYPFLNFHLHQANNFDVRGKRWEHAAIASYLLYRIRRTAVVWEATAAAATGGAKCMRVTQSVFKKSFFYLLSPLFFFSCFSLRHTRTHSYVQTDGHGLLFYVFFFSLSVFAERTAMHINGVQPASYECLKQQ